MFEWRNAAPPGERQICVIAGDSLQGGCTDIIDTLEMEPQFGRIKQFTLCTITDEPDVVDQVRSGLSDEQLNNFAFFNSQHHASRSYLVIKPELTPLSSNLPQKPGGKMNDVNYMASFVLSTDKRIRYNCVTNNIIKHKGSDYVPVRNHWGCKIY